MDKIYIIFGIIGLLIILGCTTEPSSSTDLSNCKKYFDGCNYCDVEDGKITGCTEMACQEYKEPKCLEY